MTVEHLRPLLDLVRDQQLFCKVAERLARADVPPSIVEAIRMGDDGFAKDKWRGIVVGDVVRRLVARTVAQQLGPSVEAATTLYQYALSTSAGSECVAHVIQGLTELNPEATVLSIDGISAYDQISRAAMIDGLFSLCGGEVVPFVRLFHGSPSTRDRCVGHSFGRCCVHPGPFGDEGNRTTHIVGPDPFDVSANLPLVLGGVGLRSASRISASAYWASWADCLPMVFARHRGVALAIVAQLEGHPDTPFLGAAAACARSLVGTMVLTRHFGKLSAKECDPGHWNQMRWSQALLEEGGNTKQRQGWSATSDKEVLFERMGLRDRAILRSQGGPGAGLALTVSPTTLMTKIRLATTVHHAPEQGHWVGEVLHSKTLQFKCAAKQVPV